MQITVRDEGDTKVVMLDGKLDTNSTPPAEAEVNSLMDAGATKVLINFEKVSYISSSGLRFLLATAKRLKGTSGELKVCTLNEMATEVFQLSGFSAIIGIFDTEADALGDS